ncbi:MAG: response regulator transcription factor [Chloroflexi bacterium]|nr:response regulator transcription factor [Chloroflexota bacterium]
MTLEADPLLEAGTRLRRILVVDDNEDILTIVSFALEQAGFEVWTAVSGQEALDLLRRRGLPHLAIVDVLMPQVDGFEFCQQVHEFSDLPIIMLTALSHEKVVIRALEEFAEDYVVKPFQTRELVARVERVLRRIGDFDYTVDAQTSIDNHLKIDFSNQEITVDGDTISLTPTETKILYILLRQAGRIVPTETLLRRLWPLERVPEERLRVHVSRLRRKITRPPTVHEYIVSERGTGYRFRVGGSLS